MDQSISSLSILIPVFNSESAIELLVDKVVEALVPQVNKLEIVLVNDGSKDDSHNAILRAHKKHPHIVSYINLARNFGEHNAVMCGLNQVTCQYTVIIDDDFQNPPSEIILLATKITQGYDVVYSYYDQKKHSLFRNLGSKFNDKIATKLLGKPKSLYLSSFKAISLPIVKEIIQYTGPYPYIDGIIIQSTQNIGKQLCQHNKREQGGSNYTLRKLIKLWLNMFTGFSITPLRVASLVGLFMSLFAILLGIFFIISFLVGGVFVKQNIPVGWTSLIVTLTFFAGLQLIVLGLIGEYLGRLFLTVNRLPQFVIKETHNKQMIKEENNV